MYEIPRNPHHVFKGLDLSQNEMHQDETKSSALGEKKEVHVGKGRLVALFG